MAKCTLAKQREAPGAGRGPPVTPQNVPTAPALPAFLPASAATTAAPHLRHGPAARLPAPPFRPSRHHKTSRLHTATGPLVIRSASQG